MHHVSISFDDELLILRVDGKIEFAYQKEDIGSTDFQEEFIKDVFRAYQEYLKSGKEIYIGILKNIGHPSFGNCNICHAKTDLRGCVCNKCSQT